MTWQDILSVLFAGLVLKFYDWFMARGGHRVDTNWTAKLNQKLEAQRNEYTREIELLRAEIAERSEIFAAARASLHIGFVAAHPRISDAVANLWSSILKIRKFSTEMSFVHEIFMPDEIEDPAMFEKIKSLIPHLSDEEFSARIKEFEGIEEVRPFLSESLWRKYFLYRAFAFRLAFKMKEERARGKFYAWNKNWNGASDESTIISFVGPILEEKLLGQLIKLGPPGIHRRILDEMEKKMLDEMNEWIFGRRFSSLSVEEHERVRRFLSSSPPSGKTQSEV